MSDVLKAATLIGNAAMLAADGLLNGRLYKTTKVDRVVDLDKGPWTSSFPMPCRVRVTVELEVEKPDHGGGATWRSASEAWLD